MHRLREALPARIDGGVNHTAWVATAFASIKNVVRTCQKQRRSFLDYGLSLVRATLGGDAPPLPLADTS